MTQGIRAKNRSKAEALFFVLIFTAPFISFEFLFNSRAIAVTQKSGRKPAQSSPNESASNQSKPGASPSPTPTKSIEPASVPTPVLKSLSPTPLFQWKTGLLFESPRRIKITGKLLPPKDSVKEILWESGKEKGKISLKTLPDIEFEIPMTSTKAVVVITLKTTKKESKTEVLEAKLEAPDTFGAGEPRRTLVGLLIGAGSRSFSQTGVDPYSGLRTGVEAYGRFAPIRWLDFGANIGFDFLSTGSTSIRELNAQIDIGYRIPWPKDPWKWSILAGEKLYFQWVTSDLFGYQGLFETLIKTQLRRSFGNGGEILTYVQYGFVSDGFSYLGFTAHELGAGATYIHPVGKNFGLSFGLEVSQIGFTIRTATLQSLMTSLNIGFLWGPRP